MKRTKKTKPTPQQKPRTAKKGDIVAELKKVNDRQLRDVSGGAEYICYCWHGCYCG